MDLSTKGSNSICSPVSLMLQLQAGAPAQHAPAAFSLPVQASSDEQGSQDQHAVPPSSTSDSGSVSKKASTIFGKLLHPHHHKTT